MKIYILILPVIALMAACVEKAKISVPETQQKLVVSCFISPGDSQVTATVRLSKSKYGYIQTGAGLEDDIKDATVLISDGVNSAKLQFNNDEFYYSTIPHQYKITAGKTYYLSVSTPDGKQANATTTVPEQALNVTSFDINVTNSTASRLEYISRVEAEDIPSITNHVAVITKNTISSKSLSFFWVDTTDTGGGEYTYFDTDETVAKRQYFHQYTHSADFFSDTINFARCFVHVLNCSRDFYLYHQSILKSSQNAGNPFADPVLVYTNINNGFGCFGSFVKTTMHRKIR